MFWWYFYYPSLNDLSNIASLFTQRHINIGVIRFYDDLCRIIESSSSVHIHMVTLRWSMVLPASYCSSANKSNGLYYQIKFTVNTRTIPATFFRDNGELGFYIFAVSLCWLALFCERTSWITGRFCSLNALTLRYVKKFIWAKHFFRHLDVMPRTDTLYKIVHLLK